MRMTTEQYGHPEQWAEVEFMVRFHRVANANDDAEVLALLVDDYRRGYHYQLEPGEHGDETLFHVFLERVEDLWNVNLAWALGVTLADGLSRPR